jgi:nucleotide-binding universal stress UspA family protein
MLARRRSQGQRMPFKVLRYPVIPITGAIACTALALFQGFAVPSAGLIAAVWLGFGSMLYFTLFSRRARVVDASTEAADPQLVRLRGKSPLVLVPIANPANAEAMITTANALTPPGTGRVLLLSVVTPSGESQKIDWNPHILSAQQVLRKSLRASLSSGTHPEALTTMAMQAWPEIIRVSKLHRCESILLGYTQLTEHIMGDHLEDLMDKVNCDVVLLRAPTKWQPAKVSRVLVPVAGRSVHDELRARLLSSLCRISALEIIYLKILSEHTAQSAMRKARLQLNRLAREEIGGRAQVQVVQSQKVADEIIGHAKEADLVILGLRRTGHGRRIFGDIILRVIGETKCAIIMINRQS